MWSSMLRLLVYFYFFIYNFGTLSAYKSKSDYIKWQEQFLLRKTTTAPPEINKNNNIYGVKMRHSRFPNLDRVLSKVENMEHSDRKVQHSDVYYNKVRHSGWYSRYTTTTPPTTTASSLFEEYGDLSYEDEDNDDFSDYETTTQDNFDEEDYLDEEDPFSDDDDWQNEEATVAPTVKPIQPIQRKMSPISERKWELYGTRAKVEESRRNEHLLRTSEEISANMAIVHYMRVRSEGACKKPLPRVISVQKEHPDPTKVYTPHCTVLHRCADDTGCCSQHNMSCGPKKKTLVHLYFYSKTLGLSNPKVEKLPFYNHTECDCMERVNTISEDTSQRFQPVSLSTFQKHSSIFQPQNIRRCTCPSQFVARYNGAHCRCDCEDYNLACLNLKRGEEHFGINDRRCISQKKCEAPTCEYGAYLKDLGRCIKENDDSAIRDHVDMYN